MSSIEKLGFRTDVWVAMVRLKSLAPGMLMCRPPQEALDTLQGGTLEGRLPDDYDPAAPLHRDLRIDQLLPREKQIGERIMAVITNLAPGETAPVGSDDDEALHVGEKIAAAKMHMLDGRVGIPSDLIMAALVRAGSRVKYGKRNLTTRNDSLVPGLIQLDFEFTHLFIEGREPGDVPWKPFTIMGKAPRVKGRRSRAPVDITRPRIPHWECEFTIKFDRRRISPSTVQQLLMIAGRQIGFGDFRPGLGNGRTTAGRFGRFVVAGFGLAKIDQ